MRSGIRFWPVSAVAITSHSFPASHLGVYNIDWNMRASSEFVARLYLGVGCPLTRMGCAGQFFCLFTSL